MSVIVVVQAFESRRFRVRLMASKVKLHEVPKTLDYNRILSYC